MVWTKDRDSERPPISAILPRLYLGAESDVTQDGLASLGISYVLSVSRCSPQPSFLPCSRYLRIPIDDSLWDDLLPWIPQALSFIDGAISSGASVLVHCAAGISRSPALAVAYIMYRMGLDLDQAYRFVKERRPSISPNFNFLGQLQYFQSTLSLKTPAGGLVLPQLDSNKRTGHQSDNRDLTQDHQEDSGLTDRAQQRLKCQDQSVKLHHKTVNQQQRELQTPPSAKPAQKPFTLQLPAASSSLQDKRKSLTLSLTPLGVNPASPAEGALTSNRETGERPIRDSTQETHREHSAPNRRVKEQGLLSPFGFSLNKLLDWGERLLLGGLFVPSVKMGQPALPYRC
ncbi:dual specificity protein phosphatase Mpk3 [Notolabrus celidotus]|uniref:dual specificity protein phosphatase Mpk3 n=1 Tax=Notolabrus celidotus TaxID=1203425 RepID=UPI001490082E|nr:dual specificity protein phosphatase Mpk3 [Notolabrus celidotus]